MKIEIKNLSKELDKNEILTDINLTMESGKIYGLVGRNGSGKSVLLKCICGFLPPTKGKILVDKEDIFEKGKFPDSIAEMIEHPKYLPDLSAYDNLELIASIKKIATEKDIENALEIVNLENNKKQFKKFSLGMKQKLGIAQVIMENPKIMIFDEPFNGIEDSTAEKIREYLKKNKKNKIIIIATHIKEDIESLCDEIIEIKNGTIAK
ncbi:TPA: ABC transporter ATP-binding protein [Candidatus Ventrenecus stercoripullorum]|nr:ABC transporter ATP-binding protein [Candidatus Ventrenecus stercoripullorum]